MELKTYQQKAVNQLVEYTKRYLKGNAKPIYVIAPTGAGKTVIASAAIEDIAGTLKDDYDCPADEVAFIWVAPNKLQLQSYDRMKSYFSCSYFMRTFKWDELDHSIGHLEHGDVLFLNWASLDREDNIIWRDTENREGLQAVINRTKENNIKIVLFIDEEHLNANAPRASEVRRRISPDVEIRISATPRLPKHASSYYPVVIDRSDVVAEQMIKKDVIINAGLKVTNEIVEETEFFIDSALDKLKELRAAYERIGSPVYPLLLIQLPNDNTTTETKADRAKVEGIKLILGKKGISEDNQKLAIWLSDKKSPHLDDIASNRSLTEVLIFKEAISKGWDCPRAAVLLILRENMGYQFTVQTVGRILRMPQQKYYSDDMLNHGYVYINTQNDHIEITDDAQEYNLLPSTSTLRNNVNPITLPSESIGTTRVQNALNYRFRRILRETIMEEWGLNQYTFKFDFPDLLAVELDNSSETGQLFDSELSPEQKENRAKMTANVGLDLDTHKLYSVFPKDMTVDVDKVGKYDVPQNGKASLAKTDGDILRLFKAFCMSNLIKFDKRDSLSAMEQAIYEFMRDFAGFHKNEDIHRIVLFHKNRPKFVSVLRKAQERYERDMKDRMEKAKSKVSKYDWTLPTLRGYKSETHQQVASPSHAMQPYYELKKASVPEVNFRDFLNKHNESILWWYKNGDKGKEHFSIIYTDENGNKGNFYVDYIIMLRNGQLCLFDTKSPNGGIGDSVEKHNALIDYIDKLNIANGTNIVGGIIVEDGEQWLYSPLHINNAADHAGWSVFNPDALNR